MKLNGRFSTHKNSFNECRQIEAAGWEDLRVFLKTYARDGQFVVTDKGNLAKFLQETIGDGLFNSKDGKVWCFELKTENENRHNNLFLEFWSNLSRFNPGWLLKLNTDLLFYQFLKERLIYCLSFPRLLEWSFKKQNRLGWPGRLFDFPLKRQNKYDQLNDTWGFCVPITILQQEVGLKELSVNDGCVIIQRKEIAAQMKLPF